MTTMDVFEYLKQDCARLVERLNRTASEYSEWPQDRVFEETKRELEAIKLYFSKEAILTNNLKEPNGTQDVVDTSLKQRQEIETEVENLVMIHVDEPGFEQGLESIAKKMSEHSDYCEETFFPAMKEKLSDADIERVKEQLDMQVLS